MCCVAGHLRLWHRRWLLQLAATAAAAVHDSTLSLSEPLPPPHPPHPPPLVRTGFHALFADEPELAAYMKIKCCRLHASLLDVLTHSQARGVRSLRSAARSLRARPRRSSPPCAVRARCRHLWRSSSRLPRAQLFDAFIKAEYAEESLLFYDDVTKFHHEALKPYSDAAALKAEAERLMDEYVKEGAPRQINIPAAQQKATIAALTGDFGPGMFEAAKQEVYTLMSRDTLPRFMQARKRVPLARGARRPTSARGPHTAHAAALAEDEPRKPPPHTTFTHTLALALSLRRSVASRTCTWSCSSRLDRTRWTTRWRAISQRWRCSTALSS
jgi:hypothetical protein